VSVQLAELRTFVLELDAGLVAWTLSVAIDASVAEGPGLIALDWCQNSYLWMNFSRTFTRRETHMRHPDEVLALKKSTLVFTRMYLYSLERQPLKL
jgi:hypothetical protein